MSAAGESKLADRATKVLIVLIAAPALLIAVGYLVSTPVWVLFAALGFDAEEHPFIRLALQIFIIVFWLGGSWWLVRRMWPQGTAE